MSEKDEGTIISLEAWRMNAKRTACQHRRIVLEQSAGIVECRDCGVTLSAFHVLLGQARGEHHLFERVRALRAEVEKLKTWRPFLRAVRALERMWRGKRDLPCCPHCGRGLWAVELTRSSVGVRYEVEMRRRLSIAIPEGVDKNGGLSIVDGTLAARSAQPEGGAEA